MANKFTSGWTAAEDAILRDLYPVQGACAAAKALPHRTLPAVYRRATTIGLKRMFVAAPPRSRRRVADAPGTFQSIPGQSVDEWLANGGVIEHPEPRPFLRITPSATKCRPLVMPMRLMGRAA